MWRCAAFPTFVRSKFGRTRSPSEPRSPTRSLPRRSSRFRGCAGLAQAAAQAANPAIRRVATLGGNLCSVVFAASDLAPALVAAGAEVEIQNARGAARRPVEAFLARAPGPAAGLAADAGVCAPRCPALGACPPAPPQGRRLPRCDRQRLARAHGGRAREIGEDRRRFGRAGRAALAGAGAGAGGASDRPRRGRRPGAGKDRGFRRTRRRRSAGLVPHAVLPSLVRSAFQSLQAQV